MIVLNMAMQQDNVIALLEGLDADGITYTFKEKKGIKLFFETNAEDLDDAAKKAKEAIKAQPWGSVLYFTAEAVK